MATESGEAFISATNARLGIIEAAIANHQMPEDGRTERNIPATITNLERDITSRLSDQILNSLIDAKILSSANMIQAVNDAANQQRQSSQNQSEGNNSGNRWHRMPILESKSMFDIGKLEDGKTYRAFNRKMKNAMDQVRPQTRAALEYLESVTEAAVNEQAVLNPRNRIAEVIMDVIDAKLTGIPDHGMTREIFEDVNRDL